MKDTQGINGSPKWLTIHVHTILIGKGEREYRHLAAASAAKSLQSCPTLWDPVPGILQARTLEWVAISFSKAWKWKVKGKSLSRIRLSATPWTAAYQAPPSMGFSRQEYWSGVPLPSPIGILGKGKWFLRRISKRIPRTDGGLCWNLGVGATSSPLWLMTFPGEGIVNYKQALAKGLFHTPLWRLKPVQPQLLTFIQHPLREFRVKSEALCGPGKLVEEDLR